MLLLFQDSLKFLLWLLVLQIPDLFLQCLNLGLGPLPDSSLGFSVICPLLRQLLRREISDAPRGCGGGSAALFGRGAIAVGGIDIVKGNGDGGVQRSLDGLSRRVEVSRQGLGIHPYPK